MLPHHFLSICLVCEHTCTLFWKRSVERIMIDYMCVSYLLSLKVSSPILTALHSGWKLYNYTAFDWFDGFRKLVVPIPRNISELKLQSKLNTSKNFILISSWHCTFILNVNSFLFLFFRQERTGKRQVPMMYYYFIYTHISVSLNRSGYYDQLSRNSCFPFPRSWFL